MNKYLKFSLIGLLVATVMGIGAVGIAYAQGDPPRPHELLADLLGIPEEELWEEMQDGKSLEDLAEAAGIDPDEILQTLQDARDGYFKSRLEEALKNGDISEDQYNWMLEGFENGFLGGGRGPGGFHGRGMIENQEGSRPFGFGDGTRPFDGRGGFFGEGRPGPGCGMDWDDR
jgi:hypothetical protein